MNIKNDISNIVCNIIKELYEVIIGPINENYKAIVDIDNHNMIAVKKKLNKYDQIVIEFIKDESYPFDIYTMKFIYLKNQLQMDYIEKILFSNKQSSEKDIMIKESITSILEIPDEYMSMIDEIYNNITTYANNYRYNEQLNNEKILLNKFFNQEVK